MRRLRLLIGSRASVRRQGASFTTPVSPRLEVVAQVGHATDVLRKARELRPDAVLAHIDLPGLDLIAPATSVASGRSAARALLVCLHAPSSRTASQRILATVCTYLLDTTDLDDVARVLDNEHARHCPHLAAGNARRRSAKPGTNHSLTPRERQILGYVAREKTSRVIGAELGISSRTVDAHRANVMKKLNIHTIAGLTRYALEHGILDPEARS